MLNQEEKEKEIVTLECPDKMKPFTPITAKRRGEINSSQGKGIGLFTDYKGEVYLAYLNNKGEIVLKPKLIQDYLNKYDEK
ncbi:hypothetical protein FHG64_15920 [Antarcticibacterium flavum]|uniref:Uncharacterized protein n=1 Tax=Antarcticibacterium flavum TaxID=2058175 RepID=A0A5B7X5N5_9FLAO|nr:MULTISPECIES: hypothetical protein [Antarcticibacterium]MCM4161925.1 hypothetical protein [Antarcticibacterium sp. W02-3]QCY70756.1 hypothetical protein FHG64_15920 [Antarcticibacterium flavum]